MKVPRVQRVSFAGATEAEPQDENFSLGIDGQPCAEWLPCLRLSLNSENWQLKEERSAAWQSPHLLNEGAGNHIPGDNPMVHEL